ncbi:TRAF3-interacting protein 1-like isoform X3 [Varroa destructor]|nr:TRAF3-interacting protein 1-like isoform X3 [Varroa destructor]
MADEVSVRTVKKTQELLGAIIKKPQLTEKLLKKPPFRFLHDIVHNVIRTTKAFEGLYQAEELNSENVKEKEAKVSFLQKIIDAVVFASGASLSVRPSKIVAGHEPEKTNELLQTLAKVVQKNNDTKDAVRRVLAGEKPNRERDNKAKNRGTLNASGSVGSIKKEKKEKLTRSKDKSAMEPGREKSKHDDSSRQSRDKDSSKVDADTKDSSTKDKSSSSKSSRKRSSSSHRKKSPRPSEASDDPLENQHERPLMPDGRAGNNCLMSDNLEAEKNELKSEDNSIEIKHEPRPPTLASVGGELLGEGHAGRAAENGDLPEPLAISSANSPITADENDVPNDAPAPTENDLAAARALLRSARPGTSRRRPLSSLRGSGAEGLGEEPTVRPTTARALANVIVDAPTKEDKEEDDTFVQINEEDGISELHDGVPTAPDEAAAEEPEGVLVKQLLETKEQLDRGGSGSGSRIQSPLVKESAYSARDFNTIERIREHIQGVSRGALPMGRLLDLLYEDLDSMLTELSGWKEEHHRCNREFRRQMSRAEEALSPLQEQLEQLDNEIGKESESLQLLKYDIQQVTSKLNKILDGFLTKV